MAENNLTPLSSSEKIGYWIPGSFLVAVLAIAVAWIYTAGLKTDGQEETKIDSTSLTAQILPEAGIKLPIQWGKLGSELLVRGVIDLEKLENLYARRGGLTPEDRRLLEEYNGEVRMTKANAGFLLNLFWALGLSNKNDILEIGPMSDARYGGAGRFASTGGWTLADGDAMNHYSRHALVVLTPEQQDLLERISKNIYRPCCNNSTYFPDCNHGMAMLALLELMAAQGVSESEMYRIALQVNAYWFPDNYLTIGQYLKEQGISWDEADAREILGPEYSSASGFRQVVSKLTAPVQSGGGSCGV